MLENRPSLMSRHDHDMVSKKARKKALARAGNIILACGGAGGEKGERGRGGMSDAVLSRRERIEIDSALKEQQDRR